MQAAERAARPPCIVIWERETLRSQAPTRCPGRRRLLTRAKQVEPQKCAEEVRRAGALGPWRGKAEDAAEGVPLWGEPEIYITWQPDWSLQTSSETIRRRKEREKRG